MIGAIQNLRFQDVSGRQGQCFRTDIPGSSRMIQDGFRTFQDLSLVSMATSLRGTLGFWFQYVVLVCFRTAG